MSGSPLFAAIDVGSHSVKLRTARRAGGRWPTVSDRVTVTALGRGAPRREDLDPAGREATIAALEQIVAQLAAEDVEAVATVGTAVLRHAPDAAAFVTEVRERTGLALEVISGDEEARLTYLGALDALGAPERGIVACDIGGASTEFAWGRHPRPDGRRILEIGTITLTRRFGLDGAVAADATGAATAEANGTLAALPDPPAGADLVGIGATPASLIALARSQPIADGEEVHGVRLTADVADRWIERLRRLDAAGRRTLPGLHPDRAPVILAGAILIRAILARAGAGHLRVSAHGLRRGLLVDRFGAD